MAALATSASALFRGAALSVSAPAGSARRARPGAPRAEAEATATTTSSPINPSIRKESDKVVDTVQVAELSKPLVAYCRCWRSETFPLCNGAHVKHNKATGDNVGPLLLKK